MARMWPSLRLLRIEQTVNCSVPTFASVARCISVTSASICCGIKGAESSCRVAARIMANRRSVFADKSARTSDSKLRWYVCW